MQLLSRGEEACHGRKCPGKLLAELTPPLLSSLLVALAFPALARGKDGHSGHEAGALLSPQVRRAPLHAFRFSMSLLALTSTVENGLSAVSLALTQVCF